MVVFCGLFMSSGPLQAAPAIVLTDNQIQTERFFIGKHLQYLEDRHGTLTLNEAMQQPWTSSQTDKLELGFTRSVIWVRFDIINQSHMPSWYLKSWGSLTRHEQVFIKSVGQGIRELQTLAHARAPLYPLALSGTQPYRIYLRIQETHLPLNITLELANADNWLATTMQTFPLYGAVIGGLLVLACYNLILFFHLRYRSFLVLFIFIIAVVIEMSIHIGILHYFTAFRHNFHKIGSSFGFIAILSGISLFVNISEIEKSLPAYARRLHYLFLGVILVGIAALFLPYSLLWLVITGIISIAMVLLSTYKLYQLGRVSEDKPSSPLWAIIVFLLSAIPSLISATGIKDLGQLNDLILPGVLVATLLLSVTQAEHTRRMREAAERRYSASKAKDQFLATMSHELRTPMNAVVGVSTLLERTGLNTRQQELLGKLNIAARHMLKLIDQVLDLARLESVPAASSKEPFQLAHILDDLKNMFEIEAQKKGLQLEISHSPACEQTLTGDAVQLTQILVNLLGNAIKFTDTGKVSLQVRCKRQAKQHLGIDIAVSDTGIGISPRQQNKLFKAFTQLENPRSRRYQGSGLGLAISYRLVQRMGGELTVQSTPGQGSTFRFSITLPRYHKPLYAPPTSQSSSGASRAALQPVLKGMRVLLVDDDEINQYIGRELLSTLGIQADIASDGGSALRQLQHRDYDIVLMDISMPGMDGYETTHRIRQLAADVSNVTIIALTAHAISGERERCLQAGMDDYLTKPLDIDRLYECLCKWEAGRY